MGEDSTDANTVIRVSVIVSEYVEKKGIDCRMPGSYSDRATGMRRYATLAGPNGPAPDAFLFRPVSSPDLYSKYQPCTFAI
jgi:hypothetical protein